MTPLVRKILRSKNLRYRFRALGREQAFAQVDGVVIEIDLKKNNPPVRNLLHEAIHYYNPDMPHREVYELEAAEWAKLSNKDAAKLYRKIFT
jgi:transposase InsO family protein